MPIASNRFLFFATLVTLACSIAPAVILADTSTARLAMEDPANPLLVLTTSRGDIYLEMLPREAPNNVQHFMALAEGEIEIVDAATRTSFRPRYFDGMRFHRVLPDFIIQAGSPAYHSLGAPSDALRDEINADALGLNEARVLNTDGTINSMLNINSREDFENTILQPLYRSMRIQTIAELESRQYDVLQALQQMTLKRAYENQGYSYTTSALSRPISRGVVALANQGPDSNGPEFFISLADSPWLTGKYTVIGRVVEGIEVADTIGGIEIDPLRFSRLSSVIYGITRAE